ncbi:MAG TPA: helix-turn-helix domain-containing protein [Alphaproteobacteria bacterium]|jgi:DNA-binding transcriptional MerR regulator
MRPDTIGSLARETGSKVQTIRYYEAIGLLPAPARTAGNQRVYAKAHRDRLAFIRHARELGFPLDAIRELLALGDRPDQPCARADRIATAHLARVERKIAQLEALRGELARMVARCRRAQQRGQARISECRVIEALADHSHAHCLSGAHQAKGEAERFGG